MRRSASPCSKASWYELEGLRKRGQRPTGGVWVVDEYQQRRHLESSGFFAVDLPTPNQVYLVAGLGVAMIANKSDRTVEVAQQLAGANPLRFAVLWRGEGRQVVIE